MATQIRLLDEAKMCTTSRTTFFFVGLKRITRIFEYPDQQVIRTNIFRFVFEETNTAASEFCGCIVALPVTCMKPALRRWASQRQPLDVSYSRTFNNQDVHATSYPQPSSAPRCGTVNH